MVDFNNETTVGTPPGDIVKIVILERREQVIEARESYRLAALRGIETADKLHIVGARVGALWDQLQAIALRRMKDAKGTDDDPTYETVEEFVIAAKTWEQLTAAWEWMNRLIDDAGLTFIDSRPRYDRTRVEDANTKKGL